MTKYKHRLNINSLRKKWDLFMIGFLLLFITISHFLYVYKTYQYPQWDESVYMEYAVRIIPILKNPTLNFWGDILNVVKHRQPFYPVFISIPLIFLGTFNAYKISLLINGIFYAITIFTTYLLGKEFLEKKYALLAAYTFTFYGFPLFYLHFALQDTVVTSFIILSLLFLVKSIKNHRFKYAFLFSLFFAVAALVRWTAPIFIAGGLLVLFLSLFIKSLKNRKKTKFLLKSFMIFLLIGIGAPLLLYYFPNNEFFRGYLYGGATGGSDWAPDPIKNSFSKSSMIWYASVLAQQTIFFWLLFLFGLIIVFLKFNKYKFLFLSFIIPYLALTFGATWKEDRFISPVYPIMAIISAIAINELKKPKVNRIIIVLIIGLGFLNFLGASWGVGPMKFNVKGNSTTVPHSILFPMPIGHPRRIWLAPISWPPRENEGNSSLIINTILKDNGKSPMPKILLTFYIPQIEGPMYQRMLYEQPDDFKLISLFGEVNKNKLLSKLNDADYVLIKNNGAYTDNYGDLTSKTIRTFNEYLRNTHLFFPKSYSKLKSVFIPFDKTTLTIYKRTNPLVKEDFDNLYKLN